MDTKTLVQVQIFGQNYTIRGEADQDYILGVAAYVDRKMHEITEKLPATSVSSSLSKIAVLAGLNIADELMKERAQRERLRFGDCAHPTGARRTRRAGRTCQLGASSLRAGGCDPPPNRPIVEFESNGLQIGGL